MAELDGRVALVTDAGMGIGAAAAPVLIVCPASGRSSLVTGDVVRVDGGLAINGD